VADSYNKNKHHCAIKDTSTGDLVGLVLVTTDKNGKPIPPVWAESDDEYLAKQMITDIGYSGDDPQKELALRQNDWRSGFGEYVYDSDDPKRYFSSINCDARFKNMVICGPKATAIALPTIDTATVTNGDMELDANWTTGAGTAGRDANNPRNGTYAWRCDSSAAGVDSWAYQDVSWDADWAGLTFKFQCYASTGTAGKIKVGINDGVGTTYGTAHTGGGGWELLTVTRRLDASATRLRLILMTENAGGAVGDFDDASMADQSTVSNPVDFEEFNDELYVAAGEILLKLNGTGDGFTTVWGTLEAITDLEAFTDDNLYIARGTSQNYYYMSTAEAFTESTATDKTYQFFETVHTTAPTLYGNDGVNTIRSTVDPLNGGTAWSAQTTVGSSWHSITRLLSFSGALYIMKGDMPYYLDSSGNVQNDLAPELEMITDSNKGKNSDVWLNKLYIHAATSLLEYDNGTCFLHQCW